ncbi:MAG: DUF721 domain-containing protein [Chlamydiae bacterium]|nr:DUF721 domain-containing protein [Chlamydiota bacterium]
MQYKKKEMQVRRPTGKHISDLIPNYLKQIERKSLDRPDLIMAAWPAIIGKEFAPMTRVISFDQGILAIKVKNSSLYSLLSGQERGKLLDALRKKFPSVEIKNIRFSIG